jgi:acetoin utilization deacetylase AcuC-like enzyme
LAARHAQLRHHALRVLIVDWDVHHGNGTQDIFYDDPRVLYVSTHQHPLYPGTGRLDERGAGEGTGTTVNLPYPPGAAGDAYRAGFDEVVVPAVEAFQPTWLVISAGFDAHRNDPLTQLGLTAGDFADLTARLVPLVPAGRRLAMLEGGYDFEALARSTAACIGALGGVVVHPEAVSSAGPGRETVSAARELLAE